MAMDTRGIVRLGMAGTCNQNMMYDDIDFCLPEFMRTIDSETNIGCSTIVSFSVYIYHCVVYNGGAIYGLSMLL